MRFLHISHQAISFCRDLWKDWSTVCNPILRDADELKARIIEAVATIDNAMLGRVWQKLDYRLEVCRVTNGAHIEHF